MIYRHPDKRSFLAEYNYFNWTFVHSEYYQTDVVLGRLEDEVG